MNEKTNFKIKKKVKKRKTKHTKMKKPIVPDTSVIINGILSDLISENKLENPLVIIPKFVMEELQAQASRGRQIGFKGLEEIKTLRSLEKRKKLKIEGVGRRQTYEEIQLAKYGRIDSLIIEVAKQEQGILYTADMVQKLTAEAEGVETEFFEPYEKKKTTELSKLLTKDTMSLHLKEGVVPLAKRGKPGKFRLVKIGKKKLTREYLEKIIKEITDAARYEEDSFVELGGREASVIQLGDRRIAICRPPFSEALEITVVRPILKASLDNYKLADKLKKRLGEKAEGVLIAGPPGSGKSTFAAALAEFYEGQGKIVKTMESPRDLQVKPEITQYSALRGRFDKTADILLLVRPDYTIFDEIRKTQDFKIFADMRLSGIGMIGVVHATEAIDAIQRFIGRIELGMIPHVMDTIIFIKAGEVKRVYSVSMTVRPPTGMNDEDLARPLVEVRDFETNNIEYEIYTFGEENIVVPVQRKEKESGLEKLARQQIYHTIRRFDKKPEITFLNSNKVLIRVDNDVIPKIIGKKGRTIQELEKELGLSIEVEPKVATLSKPADFSWEETGAYIVFSFDTKFSRELANFYKGDDYIFSATIGRSGQIRINKKSELGQEIMKGLIKKELKVFV